MAFKESVGWFVHGVAHRLLKSAIGQPLCAAAHAAGLTQWSRRGSRHSNYVPAWVSFSLRSVDGSERKVVMSSASGSDQVVRSIWLGGLPNYERPLPSIFMNLVARGEGAILDVGANSGLYALIAASANPACQVVSFEPFPEALRWLKTNLRANSLSDRVTLIEAAAGNVNGTSQLFIPEKSHGNALETSASLVKEFRQRHSEVLQINVRRIDDVVAERRIGKIDILRADVEGAEHLVLHGAMQVLKEHRPICIIEVLADVSATYLEAIRQSIGYRVLALAADQLVELPEVRCVPGAYNQLWYPPEARPRIEDCRDALGLPITSTLAPQIKKAV